ncbi:universal stress protein [Sphingobacterium suaedae]|uniref:Universal stress protein n=1 Tax=Sphingobacterium suaedae TaxID=1686402 RepID=A0ABW5KG41_9SPHI
MKTILILTDFSETALHAATYAADLGKQIGAERLIIYHSYGQVPVATDIPVPETDSSYLLEFSLRGLEEVERALRKRLDPSVEVITLADELPVDVGMKQLIEQWAVGLVVVGQTGKTGWEKFWIGSHTARLIATCPVNLLIIPKGSVFLSIDNVLFACELNSIDRTVPTGEVDWWLRSLGARLLVLNVATGGSALDPDTIPEQYKLHELLDVFSPQYHYIQEEDVVDGISKFAVDHHVGLVMAVPKNHNWLERVFRRSVSKNLSERTWVPLLLLHAPSV